MFKRIRVLNGYAAHARFCGECESDFAGHIPAFTQGAYSYSPSMAVRTWGTKRVVIVETRHRRYEVFDVTDASLMSDDAATAAYLAAKAVNR